MTEPEKDKEIAMLKAQLEEQRLQLEEQRLQLEETQSRLEEKQLELDVSNATLDVMLKKCEGAGKILSNTGTRAAVVGALREKYLLPKLLGKCARSYRCGCGMPKSACYCYASGAGESPKKKKDGERGVLIKDIFFDNNEIYGYRRIRAALERAGRHLCWP